MNQITACVVPLLLCAIGVYALYKRVDVFPTFLKGAKTGLQTALSIFPTLVGLLTAVYMLRASGFIDVAGNALAPVLSFLGIPKDCAALVLLKPVSGSGGLALGSEIMKQAGADSYAGRVAAVMLGASETSLYTVSLYSGHLGLRDTRYAVPAALLGDLTAFVASAFFVRLLFA
ncbi:spore maturation protein [Intestinibacillus massiliensis]|uniref:spore maturation protein n=1 Tax=Intestinibacillus massiliensis TaxID=1871029 RepID=UPI002E263A72